MYALFSLWQMPDQSWDRLKPMIQASIVPLVHNAPGALEGYWTFEPSNGKSITVVLFESADGAYDLRNALERLMEERGADGVELEMIRVQQVVARVRASRLEGVLAGHPPDKDQTGWG